MTTDQKVGSRTRRIRRVLSGRAVDPAKADVLLGNAALGGGTFIDTDDEEFSGFCRFAATLEDIPLDRPIYRVRLEGPPAKGSATSWIQSNSGNQAGIKYYDLDAETTRARTVWKMAIREARPLVRNREISAPVERPSTR